jgi:hypothetical protein
LADLRLKHLQNDRRIAGAHRTIGGLKDINHVLLLGCATLNFASRYYCLLIRMMPPTAAPQSAGDCRIDTGCMASENSFEGA